MAVTHGGRVFEVARELGCDWREVLDFSASINPLGPAPRVRDAIAGAMEEITHYPDAYAARVQHALASEWDIDPECVLVGNGATELIYFAARMWKGDVLLVTPVFSEFHRAFPAAKTDLEFGNVSDQTLVVSTNPVNPTGAASDGLVKGGVQFVDESFIEFSDLQSVVGRALVLRSLTKFHALPGLRIGALTGPVDLMREWRKSREPWQVNVLAEAAVLEALRDKAHQQRTREYVTREALRLWDVMRDMPGVQLCPTHANFYFARLRYPARALCDYMRRHRILLRDCSGWPGVPGEAVRFAIRTRAENDRLLELWRAFPCD